MEEVLALDVGVFRFLGLVTLVAGIEQPFQHVFRFGDGPGVDRARLDDIDGRALRRPGDADLVAALGHQGIAETAAGDQRACRRDAEAHGQRDGVFVAVMLGDHLPHVGTGRDLEGADIAPAEIHAVVADMAAAIEIIADHAGDAGTDGQLGLELGVADGGDVFVDVEIVGDHLLLARRPVLGHLPRLDRVIDGMGQLVGAIEGVLEAEHLVDDVGVGEQVGDGAGVGFAFDVVEHHHRTPVQMLLQAGDLEIGIDLLVGLDHVAFAFQPLQRGAQA